MTVYSPTLIDSTDRLGLYLPGTVLIRCILLILLCLNKECLLWGIFVCDIKEVPGRQQFRNSQTRSPRWSQPPHPLSRRIENPPAHPAVHTGSTVVAGVVVVVRQLLSPLQCPSFCLLSLLCCSRCCRCLYCCCCVSCWTNVRPSVRPDV